MVLIYIIKNTGLIGDNLLSPNFMKITILKVTRKLYLRLQLPLLGSFISYGKVFFITYSPTRKSIP